MKIENTEVGEVAVSYPHEVAHDFPEKYMPHVEACGIPEKIIVIGGGETKPLEEWLVPGYKILSINNHAHDLRNRYLLNRYEIFLQYTFYRPKRLCEKLRKNYGKKYPIVFFNRKEHPEFIPSIGDFKINNSTFDGMGEELNQCMDELKKIRRRISTGCRIIPWLKCSKVKKIILVGFDGWKNSENYTSYGDKGPFLWSKYLHNLNVEYKYIHKCLQDYGDKILLNTNS
jgi:hypothetical protein